MRTWLLGAALTLSTGSLSLAQTLQPPSPPPTPSATPQGSVNPPRPIGLKAGMLVTDSNGQPVGKVVRVGQSSQGAPAVLLEVDGRQIGVPQSVLTVAPSGDHAVSTVTKAQILASSTEPQPKPG